jgi:hypothetical protein
MKTTAQLLAEIKRHQAALREQQTAPIGCVAIPGTEPAADAPKPVQAVRVSGNVKPKPEAALPASWQRRI